MQGGRTVDTRPCLLQARWQEILVDIPLRFYVFSFVLSSPMLSM